MKTVIIGAGNVATHLSMGLHNNGFDILQVWSRTLDSANELAEKVSAKSITKLTDITGEAELYIFSVKDAALEEVLAGMPKTKGIWIHTAGSIPIEIFAPYFSDYGVLYPFQTFSKNREVDWKSIPIFVEASNSDSLDSLVEISNNLSERVAVLSSDKRKYLHLTGVFACNFVNHMYHLSNTFLQEAYLPFDVVFPLIEETCSKVHTLSPKEAQTGPAVRYDQNVISKHLELIDDENVRELYKAMSESIYKYNK